MLSLPNRVPSVSPEVSLPERNPPPRGLFVSSQDKVFGRKQYRMACLPVGIVDDAVLSKGRE